jgi:prepilin-type N-terminal cleavage/methylation domain-containing protein
MRSLFSHRSYPWNRRGVTLLEVLVSILIMSIGVLSVAALLPMGAIQTSQGRVADQAAAVGQGALRDFRIRGMSEIFGPDGKTSQWYTASNAAVTTNGVVPYKLPILIDPWMIARHGSATPYLGGVIQPFTINGLQTIGAADQVVVSNDDLMFDRPTDGETRPTQIMSSGVKRQNAGDFSWMAMLTAPNGDDGTIAPNKEVLLSIVVFNHRSSDQNNQYLKPATVQSGYSGPNIQFQTGFTVPNLLPGSWVLVVNNNSSNPPHVPCKWYKVGGVGYDTNAPPQVIYANLIGPDWDTSSAGSTNVSVIILDGVVGVYEKMIRLEGPSQWSN